MKFQKFHLNRIKYLILILLSIVFLPSVKAIVSPTNDFYVNDYANILSSETEQYIMNRSVALNNADGTQIVVVTVNNLEGMSIEDYSLKVARSFGIGSAEKDNGLLLLIALEERELRIEVGAGLEGIIPDGKAGRFRDEYMIPYLKENNWDDGIKNGYDAFYKEIVTLNNLNIDYTEPVNDNTESYVDNEEKVAVYLCITIFSGAIPAIIIKESQKEKRKKYTIIYFIILGVASIIVYLLFPLYLFLPFLNFLIFLLVRFSNGSGWNGHGGFYTGGGSSRRGSSRSSSFRGGGGSFRGGGTSGRF